MKYCIWNNKGGIGKTFISFCLSVEYAFKNPEKNVIAVDMCPQANLSEMILGGNGRGQENQEKLCDKELTVAHYIKARYIGSMWSKLGTETTYFVRAKDYNPDMPENLYLLCGDIDLDLCSRLIDEMSGLSIQGAWKRSRNMLLDLLQTYEKSSKNQTVFFIDCNPSFSTYTEVAILSADRLIIPCTADFASIRGIDNVFKTLYGSETSALKDTLFSFDAFSERAKENGALLPKVHSFILNKSRVWDKKAAKAYMAHVQKISEKAAFYKKECAESFIDEPHVQTVFNVKDGNTLVLVVNQYGLPMSQMSAGKYIVYGENTQVNQDQLERILEDMMLIVDVL